MSDAKPPTPRTIRDCVREIEGAGARRGAVAVSDDTKPTAPRLPNGQFPKGVSGNPGGREKHLEKRVRELLGNDIDAMTLAMRDIVLGKPPTEEALKEIKVTTRDRIEAYKVLTDRGWGKPKQDIKIGNNAAGRVPKNIPKATDEQLRVLATLDEGLGDEDLDDELDELDATEAPDGDGATQH